MKFQKFPSLRAAAIALPLVLGACATGGDNNDVIDRNYIARDVATLYTFGKDTLDASRYRSAAAIFDEVERQHPYSVWARRAQLMSAFSYYMAQEYQDAISASQRFLSLHPGNKSAPYAYYLIALSHYEQIEDVQRDQQTTQQALASLTELTRRYPDTPYAADARLKIDLARDHLAGKEMEIGRFYQERRQYIAAVKRFENVVQTYDTTSHAPEALHRLVETYLLLGIPEEAKRTAAVLGHNYPGNKWYRRSYELVREHAA
ncbi:MAG: outer membrane protein assembly factor BamD [Pacificimonas sp.]